MNHPLEFAKGVIEHWPDPLGHINFLLKHEHNSWYKKNRNAHVRFFKKAKNHIKELIKK